MSEQTRRILGNRAGLGEVARPAGGGRPPCWEEHGGLPGDQGRLSVPCSGLRQEWLEAGPEPGARAPGRASVRTGPDALSKAARTPRREAQTRGQGWVTRWAWLSTGRLEGGVRCPWGFSTSDRQWGQMRLSGRPEGPRHSPGEAGPRHASGHPGGLGVRWLTMTGRRTAAN